MKNICKKNAFRQKIRKNYIQGVFAQKRKQMLSQNQSTLTKTDQQFYSPAQNYQISPQRIESIQKLINQLPHTIQTIVQKLNDYPNDVRTIIVNNLQKLTSTFPQTNLIQWSNYIHVIQNILVFQSKHSTDRIQFIHKTSGPILYRVNKLCQTHKVFRKSIIKNYYDYLITIGSDIVFLDAIDITLIMDNLRKNLLTNCSPQQISPDCEQDDLLNSLIVLCNNIVSLNPQKWENGLQNHNRQYESQQIKIIFMNQFNKHPKLIKNMSQFAISAESLLLQQILRFLINYTYLVNDKQHLHKINIDLQLVIECVLADNRSNSYQINILVLRLINNLVVSGEQFCSILVEQSVLFRMVRVFGSSYIHDNPILQNKHAQFQIGIERQFISTLASCIIVSQQKGYLIGYFENKCGAKPIILQTLRIAIDQADLLIKSLECILIFLHYQSHFFIYQLSTHRQIFEEITQKYRQENIATMNSQILGIIQKYENQLQNERQQQ